MRPPIRLLRSSMNSRGTAGPIAPKTTGTDARKSGRTDQKPKALHRPSEPFGKIVRCGCRRSSVRAISWLSQ